MKKNVIVSILAIVAIITPSFVSAEYSNELKDAYKYAYNNGITTMTSIEKADMEWNLTRIAMAKMISNYAINVLWLQIDSNDSCSFSDVSNILNSNYDNWVTNACKLWLMGQNMPNNKFRPMDSVTRAEFWTTLSRTLHKALWTTLKDWTPNYYSTHLNYLNTEKVMNDISNPSMLEVRWYVMLMMMRASNLVDTLPNAWECVTECFDTNWNVNLTAENIYNCLLECVD